MASIRTIVFGTALVLVAPSSLAHETSKQERAWYGYQTLLTDGAAALLFGGMRLTETKAGDETDPPKKNPAPVVLGALAVGVYGVGAPLVHLLNGEGRSGLYSLGGRLLFPLAGAGLGALTGLALGKSPSENPLFVASVAVGLLTMPVIDAVALAWRRAPEPSVSLTVGVGFDAAQRAGPRFTLGGAF